METVVEDFFENKPAKSRHKILGRNSDFESFRSNPIFYITVLGHAEQSNPFVTAAPC